MTHHTHAYDRWDVPAWTAALATFGVLDVATTIIGIEHLGALEANPLVDSLIASYGLWVLVPTKLLVVGLFGVVYLATPRPYRTGVPLGLALLGLVIVCWNAFVLWALL